VELKEPMASSIADLLTPDKEETTLLVLFIPSVDRDSVEIEQDPWVERALETLGAAFGGATAFPKAKGVWRDDARDGQLVFDEPVLIHCYTSTELIVQHGPTLRQFLVEMGEQTRQGAVGMVIGTQYFEIGFPLDET